MPSTAVPLATAPPAVYARMAEGACAITEGRRTTMFEIWRHRTSGERYLVSVRAGVVNVAAGPLTPSEEPRATLERHLNQNHNMWALLHLRQAPEDYVREYTTDSQGRAVPVTDQPVP